MLPQRGANVPPQLKTAIELAQFLFITAMHCTTDKTKGPPYADTSFPILACCRRSGCQRACLDGTGSHH